MANSDNQNSGGQLPDEQNEQNLGDNSIKSGLQDLADQKVSPFGNSGGDGGQKDRMNIDPSKVLGSGGAGGGSPLGGGSSPGGGAGGAAASGAANKEGSANDKAQEAGRQAIKAATGGGKGGGGSGAGGAGGIPGGAGGAGKIPGADKVLNDKPLTKADQQKEEQKGNTEKNIDTAVKATTDYFTAGVGGKVIAKLGGTRGVLKKAGITLGVLLAIIALPIFLLLYVIQNPWEAVSKVLTDQRTREFVLQSSKSIISQNGISGSQLEVLKKIPTVEIKPGHAIAATVNGVEIKEGSTEEKLLKIDWKKAKYQTLNEANCGYELITKELLFQPGNKIINAPDYVEETSTKKRLTMNEAYGSDVVTNCLTKQYPIFNLFIRQPLTREINHSGNLYLSYAGDKDTTKELQGEPEVAEEYVYDKTIKRITTEQSKTPDLTPYLPQIKALEDDYAANVNNFNAANPGNKIKYEESKRGIPEKIKQMYQKMADGTSPYDINVDEFFNIPSYTSTGDPNLAGSGIAMTICPFVYGFMDIRDPNNPVAAKNARLSIESRMTGAQRGSMKSNTLSDTRKADQLSNVENNFTIQQLDNWASSSAYSIDVYNNTNGVHMDPEGTHSRAYNANQSDVIDSPPFKEINRLCKEIPTDQGTGAGAANNIKITEAYAELKKFILQGSTNIFTSTDDFGLEQIITGYVRTGSVTAVSGLEPGPGNYNRQSMGFRQLTNFYNTGVGARFLQPEEATQFAIETENIRRQEEKRGGIAYRLFNTNNIRSLASVTQQNTITPKTALTASKNLFKSILNPLRSLASIHSSTLYFTTGEYNKAFAASESGDSYFKIDTAVMLPSELEKVGDMLANSKIIEDTKQKGTEAQKRQLSQYEECIKKQIPTKQYFQVSKVDKLENGKKVGEIEFFEYFPEETKRELNLSGTVFNDSPDSGFNKMVACKNLFEDYRDFNNPEHQLAIRFRANTYYNNMLDLMGKLSSDESDDSIYAGKSGGGSGGSITGEGEFIWPTKPGEANLGQCFHGGHAGLDIFTPSGSDGKYGAYATKAGKVVIVKEGSNSGDGGNGGAGNYVSLDHGEGKFSRYLHLHPNSILVKVGDEVKQGQELGKIDNTGRSFGTHLHFEIREGGEFASAVNPLDFVKIPEGVKNTQGCKGKMNP